MEGSSSRKRDDMCCGDDDDDDLTVIKRPRTPVVYSDSDNMCSSSEEEDTIKGSWVSSMDQDDYSTTVDELMKFLDDNITTSTSTMTKVKFIENPYSSPLIFQSSSSYITINGNEETCGSSFSDWESSVMASVHMGGFAKSKLDRIDGFEFCDWFQDGKGDAWGFHEMETSAPEDCSGGCGGAGGGFGWDFDYERFLVGGGCGGGQDFF